MVSDSRFFFIGKSDEDCVYINCALVTTVTVGNGKIVFRFVDNNSVICDASQATRLFRFLAE
jgi:hypothetical protein